MIDCTFDPLVEMCGNTPSMLVAAGQRGHPYFDSGCPLRENMKFCEEEVVASKESNGHAFWNLELMAFGKVLHVLCISSEWFYWYHIY